VLSDVAHELLNCGGVAVLVRTLGDFEMFAVVAAGSADELANVVLQQIRNGAGGSSRRNVPDLARRQARVYLGTARRSQYSRDLNKSGICEDEARPLRAKLMIGPR
jgi:hypothetical protein